MHYFLRNHGMKAKIHHFSIKLCVLSRTTVQRKCRVAFLHSWLYTLTDFDSPHSKFHRYHAKTKVNVLAASTSKAFFNDMAPDCIDNRGSTVWQFYTQVFYSGAG